MRGVWINGEHKNPDALPLGLGWDTMLPFWGTLLPFEGDIRPGRNSVCALVEAETTGFFPVDGGALSALIRLHRKGGVIDRIVSGPDWRVRSEEHTSELQSLMRISYAVFCLKKNKTDHNISRQDT